MAQGKDLLTHLRRGHAGPKAGRNHKGAEEVHARISDIVEKLREKAHLGRLCACGEDAPGVGLPHAPDPDVSRLREEGVVTVGQLVTGAQRDPDVHPLMHVNFERSRIQRPAGADPERVLRREAMVIRNSQPHPIRCASGVL
jgi:hypothetical protein